jgi:exodeoxyribonuclease VII large subunit
MQPRPDEVILSVSELNREARDLLETALPGLWVEGEISNFVHHGSGHMYFNLKDEQAQIRCAMFRRANQRLNFRPEDGLQILLQGKVTIYEPRGSYQIVAEQMEPAGEGLLRRQFEALKARLQAEGLFSDEHKQPLPDLPARIGVITSPTGAAIRDILKVLRRRFAGIPIVIYPAQVQGERARSELAAALATAGRRNECDVLICGRGGGSLEDLWSFNEEQVVRAIFDCPIPVISAVGHESDITLADLVADVRAPTPSAAAELAVPDASEWQQQIARLTRRGTSAVQRSLRQRAALHTNLAGRLRRRNPGYLLRQNAQRIDELGLRLRRSALQRINTERARLLHANARLAGASPSARCRETGHRLQGHRLRMITALRTRLAATRARLGTLAASLNVASPLATLERGYAIVTDSSTGLAVTDAGKLKPGDTVETRVAKGRFEATVNSVSTPKNK